MRKLFLSIVAAAALITSCSKDDTTSAPINQRSKVTFAVNAPELATRAGEGEGLQAKNLEYVIYDLAEDTSVEANLITGTADFTADGDNNPLTTTVEVDLVEGRTYEAIFFATADNAPYTFNKTEQTMTINTEKLMANQESYDAFYKYVEPFTIEATAKEMDVEMTRPFAQLNVATDDFDKDGGKLIDANTTGIEVTAYTTLDFKSGDVDGKKTIVYGLSDKMDGTIKANTKDYDWLTMNYLLVNARELVDVKFVFTDEPNNLAENPLTRNYGSVPVERNYRTNIVGSILTNKTEFNVTILPGFETPDEIYDVDKTEEVVVNSAQELQAAIDNAVKGLNIIKLDKNITTTSTRATNPAIVISQKEGVNLVIDGDGYSFDGTIYIDGNARTDGAETLTLTNINFKHSNGAIDFISSNDGADGVKRYAHNITVENCTFTGNANGNVVGMRFRQSYGNINVVNCTVKENMFLLMWATNMNALVTFDGVTANNNLKEGAISLNGNTKAVIKNSNIKTTGYGLRLADGDTTEFDITFENNTISADVPVAVRSLDSTEKVNVSFDANNKLTALNNNLYDVVFTQSGTYNELVAPAKENGPVINLTGADDFNVFPRDVAIATADELKAFRDAVNNGNTYAGKVVKLVADIDLGNEAWTPIGIYDSSLKRPRYDNNFVGTFDGNGHTIKNLTVNNAQEAGLFGTMTKGVIKNLTIDDATLTANHYAGGIVGWVEAGAGSLTIENCHVKNATITVNVKDNDLGDKAGGIIGFSYKNSIIGCSVENTTIKAYRDCGGIVGYANGGTVKNNSIENVTLEHYNCPTYADTDERINSETHPSLNFGDIIGRRGSDAITEGGNSGSATKQGGIFDGYYVNVETKEATVWKQTGLEKSLQDGATTINLQEGTYIIPDNAQNKTLTFVGADNPEDVKLAAQDDGSTEGDCDYSLDGATVTFENVTITTIPNTGYPGYVRMKGTFKNCIFNNTYTIYAESSFEKCTFNVSGDCYNIWTWGGKKVSFSECTFNCDGKAVLVYNSSLDVTFDTCIFNDKGSISGKAAIETGVDNGNTTYNINITNCTVNGFDVTGQNATTYGGTNLGTNVWGNKNLIPADKLNVTIDGVDVY